MERLGDSDAAGAVVDTGLMRGRGLRGRRRLAVLGNVRTATRAQGGAELGLGNARDGRLGPRQGVAPAPAARAPRASLVARPAPLSHGSAHARARLVPFLLLVRPRPRAARAERVVAGLD